MALKLPEPEPFEHFNSWAATTGNSTDAMLRSWGFKIHARPKVGQVLWIRRDGQVVTQRQAIAYVKRQGKNEDP